MSEAQASEKLASLKSKGCVEILRTEHKGRRIKVLLPNEMSGVTLAAFGEAESRDIEELDFYEDPTNRLAILERENHRCFYTLVELDEANFVVDHVVSRPEGSNSYRNVVAASREANNKKGALDAAHFLRTLYREGVLSELELKERLELLMELKAGSLKPEV